MTKTRIINGKRRYSEKATAKDIKQWEASASRLNALMELAGISAKKIQMESELSEKVSVIHGSNLSDYRHARREIKEEHLEFISEILYKALKKRGFKYDYDILTLYLSGVETTCETYEEFSALVRNRPDIKFKKYEHLFKIAGFILSNSIELDNDDTEYGLYFNGVHKHLTPDEIETYYQRIIKYMQDSFSELKEGDALD